MLAAHADESNSVDGNKTLDCSLAPPDMSTLISNDFKEDSFANIRQSPSEETKLNLKDLASSPEPLSNGNNSGHFKLPDFPEPSETCKIDKMLQGLNICPPSTLTEEDEEFTITKIVKK